MIRFVEVTNVMEGFYGRYWTLRFIWRSQQSVICLIIKSNIKLGTSVNGVINMIFLIYKNIVIKRIDY